MKILVILGMHRCGTSVLTSYIETLGYSIGKTKNQDKNWQNPNGYWENDSLIDFHDKLLSFNQCSWQNVNKINLDYNKNHVLEYCNLIKKGFKTNKIVIKDPRLTFFYNFIKDVSKVLNTEIKVIFATRDKEECISSLHKAQNIDLEKCEKLYNNSENCYKKSMLKIKYNDFVKNNLKIRNEICGFLNEKDSTFDKVDLKLYRENKINFNNHCGLYNIIKHFIRKFRVF